MKRRVLIMILIWALIIFSTTITLADLLPEQERIFIERGENKVLMPLEFSPVYVSNLIKEYPEIIMVTYFSENIGKEGEPEEIGYVNVFGGVGKNFIIYGNSTYFITVENDLEVLLR